MSSGRRRAYSVECQGCHVAPMPLGVGLPAAGQAHPEREGRFCRKRGQQTPHLKLAVIASHRRLQR